MVFACLKRQFNRVLIRRHTALDVLGQDLLVVQEDLDGVVAAQRHGDLTRLGDLDRAVQEIGSDLTGQAGSPLFAPDFLAWLQDHAPTDGSVIIEDISAKYATIGLWGPRARDVLQAVCEDDVSNTAFPYFTAQSITVDAVPCVALRLSYLGELGWELYAPMEYGLRLWDVLWEAGQEHGIFVGGQGAFDSLRLEKGYRSWGADIHTDYNPYEAGIGWAVRLKKGDFLGRDALRNAREAGISQKLCCMTFDTADGMALGKEPVLDARGETVLGYVTSANYGYSVGKHILYAYLPAGYAAPGTSVQVQYFGALHAATVVDDPLYDAEMMKLKS